MALPRALHLLLLICVLGLIAVEWTASGVERRAAVTASDRTALGTQMLTAMLDQETGVRGYLSTRDPAFLQPYVAGRATYRVLRLRAGRELRGDAATVAALRAQSLAARNWMSFTARKLPGVRPVGALELADERRGKQLMDVFRARNAVLARTLTARRDRALARARREGLALVLAAAGLLGLVGLLLLRQNARRRDAVAAAQERDRARQGEFAEAMQIVDTEAEAHELIKRHLERSLGPASHVTVLNRNNSDNRLEPTTPVRPGTEFATRVVDADPGSCMAIRRGTAFAQSADGERLVSCTICGAAGETSCRPLLVSGQVIGSVLIEPAAPLRAQDETAFADAVTIAAPVLANMRTLAMAEVRAATDGLTGLANRRSADDTLRRMLAQASRAVAPLAAVAIDLDHFKQINDRHGHGVGDEVLAQAAAAIADVARESDFCARTGGEEFLVLAPDTGLAGAMVLAERLRQAIAAITLASVDRPITASFGVAVYPEHATDATTLTRNADRALYAAKQSGRNRVEHAPGREPLLEPAT